MWKCIFGFKIYCSCYLILNFRWIYLKLHARRRFESNFSKNDKYVILILQTGSKPVSHQKKRLAFNCLIGYCFSSGKRRIKMIYIWFELANTRSRTNQTIWSVILRVFTRVIRVNGKNCLKPHYKHENSLQSLKRCNKSLFYSNKLFHLFCRTIKTGNYQNLK